MNKNKLKSVLCFVFILQLLIPAAMISYSRYIDWGLRERAAVYYFEIDQVEYFVSTNSVYLTYDYPFEWSKEGCYASVKTGEDGLAVFEPSKKKPDGNYIRSQNDRYFVFPNHIKWYELQEPIRYDGEGNWLYMIDEQHRHSWGYGSDEPPVYFTSACAVVHVFKGYVRLESVIVDGERAETFVQRQLDAGAFVE